MMSMDFQDCAVKFYRYFSNLLGINIVSIEFCGNTLKEHLCLCVDSMLQQTFQKFAIHVHPS